MIKIYGIKEKLNPIKPALSDVINSCMVDVLQFPANKRAHRFIPLAKEDFFYPEGRTDAYTVLEINMIEGRSVEAKKKLIRLLFDRIQEKVGITHQDLEINIVESPAHNWGFRGMPGDEANLNYKIKV
jgi:phenylpyruvate tautomerase PptA (4-oxalocrotonate tautomerase family)